MWDDYANVGTNMKRLSSRILLTVVMSFFVASALAAGVKLLTATGKITQIDQHARMIAFSGQGSGGGSLPTVGGGTITMPDSSYDVTLTTSVGKDTVIKVGGIVATLKDIHVSDIVTIHYYQTPDGVVKIKDIIKKK
jgi:purine-nucleoside phosphorylase